VDGPNEQSGVGRLTCGRYGATGFVVRYKTETLTYTVTVVARLSP